MFRQIKFAEITLADGKPAVLSTVELPGGVFETMMASPDFGTEYKQLRADNEPQALADFKHLFKTYHVAPLSGRYAKLAEDLRAAAIRGKEVARTVDDGGTCNMDAVSLRLRGWCRAKVEQAAKAAGVGCFVWSLWGDKSFVFPLRIGAQGDARTAAAEAMRDVLQAANYDAGMYYQMD